MKGFETIFGINASRQTEEAILPSAKVKNNVAFCS